jgi:hypothetical protein
MKPSIGRIVHFVNKFGTGREVLAAVITSVRSDTCVNLHVFYDGTSYGVPMGQDPINQAVNFDDKGTPGTWHWPPKL